MKKVRQLHTVKFTKTNTQKSNLNIVSEKATLKYINFIIFSSGCENHAPGESRLYGSQGKCIPITKYEHCTLSYQKLQQMLKLVYSYTEIDRLTDPT